MKKHFLNILLLSISLYLGFISISCSTIMKVVSGGAHFAGAIGVIDSNVATAISKSSDSIARAAEEITPKQEYYIGRSVGASILTVYQPYTSPFFTAYINKICIALTINSSRPDIYNGYHVLILDSDEINAFATSGGHIFITRGLLQCTDSEDSLAAVIAHEVAHIQLQHSLKAIKTSRITEALAITATQTVFVAADIPMLASIFDESITEIVQTLINSGYSQVQEFEADKIAAALLYTTGYNPQSLLTMLHHIKQNQEGKSAVGFAKTHPSPDKRIAQVKEVLKDFSAIPVIPARQIRFMEAFQKL